MTAIDRETRIGEASHREEVAKRFRPRSYVKRPRKRNLEGKNSTGKREDSRKREERDSKRKP